MTQRRYLWTPELDNALREGYGKAATVRGITAAIDIVARMSGFPRYIVNRRAGKLRLTRDNRHPWTPQEIAFLRRHVGKMSVKEMAHHLHRDAVAVQSQIVHSSLCPTSRTGGFSLAQAAELLGVSRETLSKAVREGHLSHRKGRVTHRGLRRFLAAHFERLDLRLIDQRWLKAQLRHLLPSTSAANSERAV